MRYTTRVNTRTTPNPHFLHKAEVIDNKGNVVANAIAWTNLTSPEHPHGHTQLIEFKSNAPTHAKLLHQKIAQTLTQLGFHAEHPIQHSISRQKLKQVDGHFEGFEEQPLTAQSRLLITKLAEYSERFQQRHQSQLEELNDLPEFTTPKIFRETLEQYAADIPDDKHYPEGGKPRGRKAQPHENDPLFLAVPNFIDPETKQMNFIGLTKHLHPELAHLNGMQIYEKPECKRIQVKVSQWRKKGILPERKNMEYPLSEQGRAEHTPLVHWYLKNILKQYVGSHTGITYQEAVELGLHTIDMIYPKFDPNRAKFSSYFGRSFQGVLKRAVKRKARERRLHSSLDAEKYEDAPLYNFIPAPENETERGELAAHRIIELVLQVAQKRKIPPKELLLWGLVHLKGRTLQRVGDRFGVTRERIRQKTSEIQQTIKRDLKPKEE